MLVCIPSCERSRNALPTHCTKRKEPDLQTRNRLVSGAVWLARRKCVAPPALTATSLSILPGASCCVGDGCRPTSTLCGGQGKRAAVTRAAVADSCAIPGASASWCLARTRSFCPHCAAGLQATTRPAVGQPVRGCAVGSNHMPAIANALHLWLRQSLPARCFEPGVWSGWTCGRHETLLALGRCSCRVLCTCGDTI